MHHSDGSIDKPLNPVEVENSIFMISNEIAKSVRTVSDAEAVYMARKRDYDRAVARAINMANGTVQEKNAQVELATITERDKMDVAYIAWKYADRRAKALSHQLDAVRSIGASVRSMFAVAGRGEGA
ncbi:hypothetical protein QVA66_03805 [Staphylococcus chromogenes]|nr:hypothetical protein [Staphylococcus chromogenes]